MCGIIGIIGNAEAAPLLLDGLKRLVYRGYDSAGIATVRNGVIDRRRAEGKIDRLESVLKSQPLAGTTGIGHTRWATHGVPNETNAHPHATHRVAVVHNGIIENFAELKAELMAQGCRFDTQTDTEVFAHLITTLMDSGLDPKAAMAAALKRVHGAFALAVLVAGQDRLLLAARQSSPLAIGWGDGEMYLGSDAFALAPFTRRISYLDEGDWAVITDAGAQIYDKDDKPVSRPIKETALSGALIGKGNHRHFMHKEIHEQPAVIGDSLRAYMNPATYAVGLPTLPFDFATLPRLSIVACGTSFYTGLIAEYWFEQYARLAVDCDIASEFRYRKPVLQKGGAALFISQSGETIDTLAALRHAREEGQSIASIVNVPESSIARDSDVVFPTHAGPEIGVASTKAMATQLTVLACIALAAAKARGTVDARTHAELSVALTEAPARVAEVLAHDESIQKLAAKVAEARDVLYLGRGASYPVALEGALKLKEISYIHAEGYAAGEMKHGPIALIDEDVPVIVVAPSDELFEKTASNMQEVAARGGRVILLSDKKGIEKAGKIPWVSIELPTVHPFVAPILYIVPVQLLAYHVAVLKGTDVDQPRNLAKSVTVE
ncbi:MAG: glutamine--fructose-6-phosphate transaminase (isomerizing) [Alphaproteobacteria bacterium]|nr:glutamine--fructose-6-phosphate transaminase (isomerizing) [Alphaproteobacteria bacterium]